MTDSNSATFHLKGFSLRCYNRCLKFSDCLSVIVDGLLSICCVGCHPR